MGPLAEEVRGYSSDGSSRSRSQGRPWSARKHRKSVWRKKGISKSHQLVRLEAQSRSKSKSVKSKPQSVRASRRKSSSDSGYHRRAKLPPNVRVYKGNKDPEDHLSIFYAAAEQEEWPMPVHPELAKKINDKIPKTVDEIWERVRAFIKGETVVDTTEFIRSPRWEKSAGKASWLENQNGSRNRGHRRGEGRNMGTCAPYDRREGFTPLTKTPPIGL
ncbi:hypothetical protein Tco_0840694 [Tanacetum coccineum]|uniref:Uncharacterized protein n=1 Tax=Tanacetum coccineum TaxID=301880 RepID=A0ABQ5AWX1_9ASTR